MPPREIAFKQTEVFDVRTAANAFKAREQKPHVKKLLEEARNRGFTAASDAAHAGVRQKYRSRNPVPLGRGEREGTPVNEVEFELVLTALERPNSRDQAAVGTVRLTTDQNTDEYDMLLEAPNGDFNNAREFVVGADGKVVRAHSWWSATKACLKRSNCAAACLTALGTCGGTWTAYLVCVGAACGGCFSKCAACATCDCRWWCRWATGCCDA